MKQKAVLWKINKLTNLCKIDKAKKGSDRSESWG